MPERPPAGWYADPHDPASLRWWNGEHWTEHQASTPPAAVQRAPLPPSYWVALAAAAGIAIGSLGPWVDAVFVSVSGIHGDGKITLVLGLVAAGILLVDRAGEWRAARVGGILVGLAAAALAAYDVARIENASHTKLFGQQVQVGHPGWGLYLILAAAICLFGASIALPRRY